MKTRKIEVQTIDIKDIDKLFPTHSEVTMSPLPKDLVAQLATIHTIHLVKAQ